MSNLRNIKLTLQYEGTRYRGWQRLGDSGATIQGKLETLLARLTGEEVQLIGSGRTDAGVHAQAQVANFHTASSLDIPAFIAGFREYLPDDIQVTAVEEVPDRFHARYNAKMKTYRYRLDRGAVPDVFTRRVALHLPGELKLDAMREAGRLLIGENDFRSFTNSRYKNKSTVRELHEADVIEDGRFLDLLFSGAGFLHNMIRILAGTLVAVGRGELDAASIPGILEARDRQASGPMLPAHGLTLLRVEY